jgi:hypothetical protein
MRLLDTDNDGTVDLEEAKNAASTLFDKLEIAEHIGVPDEGTPASDRVGRRALARPDGASGSVLDR